MPKSNKDEQKEFTFFNHLSKRHTFIIARYYKKMMIFCDDD